MMDPLTGARSSIVSISELASFSGLELVARLADGSIRRPPMADTLPFTLLPPEEGKVGLLATPEPRFCNLTYCPRRLDHDDARHCHGAGGPDDAVAWRNLSVT